MGIATLETGSGPLVLLIHGWGGYKEGWGTLPAALADAGFRVCAVDLPGFGESPPPPGFRHTPAGYALVLGEFVRRRGPLAIVAHSMGAFPALILGARFPDLVSRLVLLGPAPLAVTSRQRWLAALPLVGSLLAAAGIWRGNRDRAATFQAFVRAAAHPERMSADPVAVAAANEATDRFIVSSPLALGRSVHHALRTRATRLAAIVTQPTLVIVGDHDRVGRPEHARSLAAALPRGRLFMVPDCGHYPFQEGPDAVDAEVIAHLRAGS